MSTNTKGYLFIIRYWLPKVRSLDEVKSLYPSPQSLGHPYPVAAEIYNANDRIGIALQEGNKWIAMAIITINSKIKHADKKDITMELEAI